MTITGVLLKMAIAMMMLLAATSAACSPTKPTPPPTHSEETENDVATALDKQEVVNNILIALDESDFTRYKSYFAREVRGDMDKQEFANKAAFVEIEYGDYIIDSLVYWKTEEEDTSTLVYYKTTFVKDSEYREIIWKAVFKDFEGAEKLTGFEWVRHPLAG